MKNLSKPSSRVSDKYVKEAIEEYNNSGRIQSNIDQTNVSPVRINGANYTVLNISFEDFLKEYNGIEMDEIKWTKKYQ